METIQVIFTQAAVTGKGFYAQGEAITVEASIGNAWIAAGIAKPVEPILAPVRACISAAVKTATKGQAKR
jgi:hypothetical protein